MWSVSPWAAVSAVPPCTASYTVDSGLQEGIPSCSPIGLGTSPVSTMRSFSSSGDSGRNGGQKCLGIRMQGIVVDRVTVTQFHQPSQIHDGDAVADIFHHAQVMDMKIYVKVKMLLQLLKQVNDLGLYGHVKS